jgi:hypothetical protein
MKGSSVRVRASASLVEPKASRTPGVSEARGRIVFSNGVNGTLADYINGVVGRAQSLAQALQQAESTEYSLPQNQPVAPTTADYDSKSSAQYGRPVYKDANGNLYDADGSAWHPSSYQQPAPPPTTEFDVAGGPRRPGVQP